MAAKTLWVANAHSASLIASQAYPIGQPTTFHKVLAFSDSADWSSVFEGYMPIGYGGGNVNLILHWASWTVTTNNCRWQAEFERYAANGNRTDTANWGTAQANNFAPGSTLSSMGFATFSALTPANIGNIAAGDSFRVRISRLGTNGGDTMVGLGYLYKVILNEI